jgi:DNA-binding NarL/FixJ family response regulator
VIADDHARMRRGLRVLLDGEDGIEVVAEAGDVAAATHHVFGERPRVLVIDLGISSGSGRRADWAKLMEAIRLVRREVPATEVVVLTMEDSRIFAQAVLDAGAIGFVLKQAAEAELPQAVRSAARGERYVSPRLTPGAMSPGRRPLDG